MACDTVALPKKEVQMFRRSCPIIILAAAMAACLSPLASVAIGGDLYRFDPTISGQVVDYDTHRPMAGVVVSAVWFHNLIRFSEAPQRQFDDYYETLTDQQGNFKIPGKGLRVFRKVDPPNLSIFKAGYSVLHLPSLVPGHSRDLPSGEDMTWIDGKAVIRFRRKLPVTRKRLLKSGAAVPLFQMARDGVPPEKTRLYTEELEKEFGADRKVTGPDKLYFKEGGIFSAGEAGEKAAKPRSKE